MPQQQQQTEMSGEIDDTFKSSEMNVGEVMGRDEKWHNRVIIPI
jgi:hypothetical protein